MVLLHFVKRFDWQKWVFIIIFLKTLKGTWGQSNNFCLKWYFFIIKQNDIYKKFQKFTCKPQLTNFVCLFAWMTLLTQWYKTLQLVREKWLKTPQNFIIGGIFSIKVKKCKESQGWHVLYLRGYDVTHTECKLCNFITSRNLMKLPQNFVQRSFSMQLTKIWHKNRGEALASNPL